MRPGGEKQRRDALERVQGTEPEAAGPGARPARSPISNQRLARAAAVARAGQRREAQEAQGAVGALEEKTLSASDETEEPAPPAPEDDSGGDEGFDSSAPANGIGWAAAAPPPPPRKEGFALPRWGRSEFK